MCPEGRSEGTTRETRSSKLKKNSISSGDQYCDTVLHTRCINFSHHKYLIEIEIQFILYEEFEDTKGIIRIRKSKKNRQHNGQKKKNRQHNGQKKKNRQHNG